MELMYEDLYCRLRKRAHQLGITDEDLLKHGVIEDLRAPHWRWGHVIGFILIIFIVMFATVLSSYLVSWPLPRRTVLTFVTDNILDADLEEVQCIVSHKEYVFYFIRPPVNCNMCKNLSSVDRVANMTPMEFEKKYAYTRRPVVIEGGQKDWSAAKTFSFAFFKSVYANDSPALDSDDQNCQFFPYKTKFHTLREVFNMSHNRAHLKDGSDPWYIGWSNCDGTAAEKLRQHYKRPYFLPNVSESSRTDWIFMGSPGHGAHLHIDLLMNPSWQAQITGRKMWILEPPSECYFECQSASHMETVLLPGDIIVVATNVWVHGTRVLGDDISISIGSEFD